MSNHKPISTNSTERVKKYHAKMDELGFRRATLQLPKDVIEFLDTQRRITGLNSRGHAVADLLRKTEEYQTLQGSKATS